MSVEERLHQMEKRLNRLEKRTGSVTKRTLNVIEDIASIQLRILKYIEKRREAEET